MKRDDILKRLGESRREISERFDVERIGLFGSAARDELREDSNLDVLVSFRGAATFDGYMGLKLYLEDLFGRKVDLVTERGLKPRVKPHVEKQLWGLHLTGVPQADWTQSDRTSADPWNTGRIWPPRHNGPRGAATSSVDRIDQSGLLRLSESLRGQSALPKAHYRRSYAPNAFERELFRGTPVLPTVLRNRLLRPSPSGEADRPAECLLDLSAETVVSEWSSGL